MRGSKYERQLMTHVEVLEMLRTQPALLDSPILRTRLEQKRGHASGLYVSCLDLWGRLLEARDLDGIEHNALGSDDHAGMMRAVSPLGCLLSDEQRVHINHRLAHSVSV